MQNPGDQTLLGRAADTASDIQAKYAPVALGGKPAGDAAYEAPSRKGAGYVADPGREVRGCTHMQLVCVALSCTDGEEGGRGRK